MECASVWINGHGGVQPNAPFGGIKQSGIGVEFVTHGLAEYTSIKTVLISK
jgi:acyl-CoA reductase-like NAD-dependent aldehyde dehydrogenase